MSDKQTDTNKPVLNIHEVAELLGITESAVRRWSANGALPAHKISGIIRFNRREIMALVGGDESLDNANDPITAWLIDQLNKRRQELGNSGIASTENNAE